MIKFGRSWARQLYNDAASPDAKEFCTWFLAAVCEKGCCGCCAMREAVLDVHGMQKGPGPVFRAKASGMGHAAHHGGKGAVRPFSHTILERGTGASGV